MPSLNDECWRGIGSHLDPHSLGWLRSASRGLRAVLHLALVAVLIQSASSSPGRRRAAAVKAQHNLSVFIPL